MPDTYYETSANAATLAATAQYNAMYANAILNGYAAWAWDPAVSSSTNSLASIGPQYPSGKLKMSLFYLPIALTISGYMASGWRQYSGTIGSNAYFGLYQFPGAWVPGGSMTGTATLLGNSSPDMSASGYGPNPQNIGVTSLSAGWYGFGCLIGTQASSYVGPEISFGSAQGVLGRAGNYGNIALCTSTGLSSLTSVAMSTLGISQGYGGWFGIY